MYDDLYNAKRARYYDPEVDQIKSNLGNGQRVFGVSDGDDSWTVDCRKKCEWVQISPSGTRRALRCTPTLTMQEDTNAAWIQNVKNEWHAIVGKADCKEMKFEDMVKYYRKESSPDDDELLFHVVDDMYRRIAFSTQSAVNLNHWIHFHLLESQAPSYHAIDQVNQRLSAWITRYSQILDRFVGLFLQSCEESGNLRLTTTQMKMAVRTWFSQSAIDMFTSDYIEHLNNLLSCDAAFEEGENITYYEFLNYMTGQSWSPVELYYYDLTKGSAWWWTPLVLGKQIPSLWHCGVVAFGKEYRYGGNIFESTPGATAFGTPQKIERIGMTCRTRQDILSYINRSLSHSFAVDSYQVLSNNSNHFCDILSLFLTNEHISSEVLSQPEDIMSSKVAQSLGQWIPWLKGEPIQNTRKNMAAERDWQSISEKAFINYEHEDGWTIPARVVQKHQCSCDLKYFSRLDKQFHTVRGVSRSAVRPWFGMGSPGEAYCLPQRKF
jgi:hypothetical protein